MLATAEGTGRPVVAWHGLTAEEVCKGLAVDPAHGLDAAEVERRRAEVGPNRLAEAATEPGWHAFLRQYRDLMQLVLVGAAIVSIAALQEFSTGIVILVLTVLNAVLGLNQEGKAAESVAALQKMLVIRAHVRRDGDLVDVPAEELVPGDIVAFEAGDKVPADGRLLVAATLEIEEAALTGESVPVLKAVDAVPGDQVPVGDRTDMAYMNSTVTRGRGEMVVSATGMSTEVGQISRMLGQVQQEKTPLTRQLDQLTVVITTMAAIALALVIVLGLVRGESFDDLFLIGISLAIAAIPTGLPAVAEARTFWSRAIRWMRSPSSCIATLLMIAGVLWYPRCANSFHGRCLRSPFRHRLAQRSLPVKPSPPSAKTSWPSVMAVTSRASASSWKSRKKARNV